MSKTFWIKSVGASGAGKRYSFVSFDPKKVNIIYGPSNSGKSYIINCIDFMFFGDSTPFTKNSTGYDTIHMTVETSTGIGLEFKRKIIDGKRVKREIQKLK